MASLNGPNHALIGVPGSRWKLNTPALVLDLDAFDANLRAMARHCTDTGQALRPHGKSHKSAMIAGRQRDAGAIGICCATIREAEAMAAAGLPGILITSPLATPAKITRLMALHAAGRDIAVVTDSLVNCRALAEASAAAGAGRPLNVVVDFDVGLQRTGAPDGATVLEIARAIAQAPGLGFLGVQAYAGHLQHVVDWHERAMAAMVQAERVKDVVARLRNEGLPPAIVTGGGTGTHDIDHRHGIFTELQAGSYIFTDVDYNRVPLRTDQPRPFAPALFVQAAVINVHFGSHAVIDAGLKSFATDGPVPEFVDGAPVGATYRFMGDEHGAVVYASGNNAVMAIADMVTLAVPHCDPNVNLYDAFHCVRGDTLEAIWPIDGRGNP